VQEIIAKAFAKVHEHGECETEIPARVTNVDSLIAGLKLCADTQRHLAEWERRKAQPATAADDEYDDLPTSFAKACRKADEKQRRKPADPHLEKLRRLLEDDVSIESAAREFHSRGDVPKATVDAVVYSLRTDGRQALAGNRARLAELSDAQVRTVIVRLSRLRANYPAITDDLLKLLAELLP
jgi:hypothetical protein